MALQVPHTAGDAGHDVKVPVLRPLLVAKAGFDGPRIGEALAGGGPELVAPAVADVVLVLQARHRPRGAYPRGECAEAELATQAERAAEREVVQARVSRVQLAGCVERGAQAQPVRQRHE